MEKPDSSLTTDLETLRRHALSHGASDAVVIPASQVLIDPRVRFKGMIPKCLASGDCDHCAPYGFSYAQSLKQVSRYRWGIFFRILVPSSIVAEPSFYSNYLAGSFDPDANMMHCGMYCLLIATISQLIGKKARELGYTSPRGFGAGNCRDILCHYQPTCQVLMTGQGCRHPELSVPSMESRGMNVFTMAARVGWEVYPVGGSLHPEDIPHGTFFGLSLVI